MSFFDTKINLVKLYSGSDMSKQHLTHALSLSKRGWLVFPIDEYGNSKITGGQFKASKDEEKVKKYWDEFPEANIGILTGSNSGIWAIEINYAPNIDGISTLKNLYSDMAIRENDLIIESPSSTSYLIFQWDNTQPVKTILNFMEGISIQGNYGSLIAPPSCIISANNKDNFLWKNEQNSPQIPPTWAQNLYIKSNKENNLTFKRYNKSDLHDMINQGHKTPNSLFKFCCQLRGNGIDYDLALGFIKTVAEKCNPPINQEIAESKVNFIYQKYINDPIEQLEQFKYNERGHGERFSKLLKNEFSWIPEENSWYEWNGFIWQKDKLSHHLVKCEVVEEELLKEYYMIKAVMDEYIFMKGKNPNSNRDLKDLKDDHEFMKLSSILAKNDKSQKDVVKASGIKNMLFLAKGYMSICIDEFDSKGKFIGVKNGVLNLPSKKLNVGDPKYLVSKYCNVVYNPDSICPNWEDYLLKICEGKIEKVEFLQRIFGQSLLGKDYKKDYFIIFGGNGANGKSTILDTIAFILNNYCITTDASAIMGNYNKEYYIAELRGIRLTIFNESDAGAKLEEATIKKITDSGKVQARKIRSSPTNFQPCATPILATNYPPNISSNHATTRRIIYIDFNHKIPDHEKNANYKEEYLIPEAEGIFNWMVKGCQNYLKSPLKNMPSSIREETENYTIRNNRLKKFISDECIVDPMHNTLINVFKETYAKWGIENEFSNIDIKKVNQDLKKLGYVVKKIGGPMKIQGITLKNPLIKSDEEQKN